MVPECQEWAPGCLCQPVGMPRDHAGLCFHEECEEAEVGAPAIRATPAPPPPAWGPTLASAGVAPGVGVTVVVATAPPTPTPTAAWVGPVLASLAGLGGTVVVGGVAFCWFKVSSNYNIIQ